MGEFELVRFYQGMPEGYLEGDEQRRIAALGAKAAGLVQLCELGMPCPPGFVIPTSVTDEFNRLNADVLSELDSSNLPPSAVMD